MVSGIVVGNHRKSPTNTIVTRLLYNVLDRVTVPQYPRGAGIGRLPDLHLGVSAPWRGIVCILFGQCGVACRVIPESADGDLGGAIRSAPVP